MSRKLTVLQRVIHKKAEQGASNGELRNYAYRFLDYLESEYVINTLKYLDDSYHKNKSIFIEEKKQLITLLYKIQLEIEDHIDLYVPKGIFGEYNRILSPLAELKVSFAGVKKKIDTYIPKEYESVQILTKKDYKETIWFGIGLKFAKGEVQKLYLEHANEKGCYKTITEKLGLKPTDRPYVSDTLSNYVERDKNIYSSHNKLKKIFKHCKEQNLLICDDFLKACKKMNIF